MRGAADEAVEVGQEGKEVMNCGGMEKKMMGYVDGRLKEGERLEMEKHLGTCAACQLRVNEFRAVNVLLDELPMIEPSAAFDVRVRARVAAEPAIGSRTPDTALNASEVEKLNQNLPVLENFDVLSNFAPLTDLPQPVQAEEGNSTNQNQQM